MVPGHRGEQHREGRHRREFDVQRANQRDGGSTALHHQQRRNQGSRGRHRICEAGEGRGHYAPEPRKQGKVVRRVREGPRDRPCRCRVLDPRVRPQDHGGKNDGAGDDEGCSRTGAAAADGQEHEKEQGKQFQRRRGPDQGTRARIASSPEVGPREHQQPAYEHAHLSVPHRRKDGLPGDERQDCQDPLPA
jgi:hypothetical protein